MIILEKTNSTREVDNFTEIQDTTVLESIGIYLFCGTNIENAIHFTN